MVTQMIYQGNAYTILFIYTTAKLLLYLNNLFLVLGPRIIYKLCVGDYTNSFALNVENL